MGTKHDIDNLLRNALYRNEKPDPRLIYKLKNQQPKVGYVKIKRVKRSFGIIAATFVLVLLLTSTALAAGFYLGAFERLTAIIGQERAGELIPIEMGNSQDEVSVKLVAIEVSYDVVYIYFTLQDLVANRLIGEFFISHFVLPADPVDNFSGAAYPPEIIYRDSEGVVTLRSRFEYSHAVEGLELNYFITGINFGEFYHPLQVVDINLADFAIDAPAALLQTYSPVMVVNDVDVINRFSAKIKGEGLPVLAPNMKNIEFGLDGIRAVISSMGVIDGRLHVQVYNPDIRAGRANVEIINKNDVDRLGDYDSWRIFVPSLLTTQFRVAGDGALYRDTTWTNVDNYVELIYDNVLDNIYEYVLVVSAFSSERISVNWNVTFDINDYR